MWCAAPTELDPCFAPHCYKHSAPTELNLRKADRLPNTIG